MGISLVTYRDQIILDCQILGNGRFPTKRIDLMINQSQRDVQISLNGLGAHIWETSQDCTAGLTDTKLASGSNNVKTISIGNTYLSNLLENPASIRYAEVDDSTNYGIAFPLTFEEFRDILRNSINSPTISDPILMRQDNLVYLAPVGITSTTIHYYKRITDLVNDDDESEIPIEFSRFVIRNVENEINNLLGNLVDKEKAKVELENDISLAYSKFIGGQNEKQREKTENQKKMS